MADELKKNFGASVSLKEGSRGVFDVKADGKLVYSKGSTGRFPHPEEVTRLIREGKA